MAQQHKISIAVQGKDDGASKTLDALAGKIEGFGKKSKEMGEWMTLGDTTPIIGLGIAAIKASTDLNAAMANVASLGVPIERVEELKSSVQDVAIEVGKTTGDIAGGLYQVISAFGDSVDTVEILRINAIAAAAGLATTEDAIALTSAVTKGFGDTSADAVQKAADLAFVTVQLGQTTFPELASAMGKVVPLAATLGITQEELFASMATLTGVTGNAAEVTTQMRATYQALIKPTADMATGLSIVAARLDDQEKLVAGPLVSAWNKAQTQLSLSKQALFETEQAMKAVDGSTKSGAAELKKLEKQYKSQIASSDKLQKSVDDAAAALGRAIVESVGQEEALRMLAETTGGNTNELAKMFGSVEALNAVLALTGSQAETYAQKLEAMRRSTGSLTAAFDAQTKGINANGFTMQQLRSTVQVLMQRLGDGLAPAMTRVLRAILPLADKAIDLSKWFVNLDEKTQTWILGAAGMVAALGPLLVGFGHFLTVAAMLVNPIGLIAAGIATLIALDVGGIRTNIVAVFNEAKEAFDRAGGGLDGLIAALESMTGMTVNAEANVTTIDWGNVSALFDADANVLSIDWGDGNIIFDAAAQVVDWSFSGGLNGFDQQSRLILDAKAKFLSWEWDAGSEQGKVILDAEAIVRSIDWSGNLIGTDAAFSYDAEAGITKVLWEEDLFTFIYDAEAGVTKVDFGMGLFYGHYTATAGITNVLWGLYRHVYEAESTVSSVVWGAYEHTYDAFVKIEKTSVLWGIWSNTYDAFAKIEKTSVLWGIWSNTYDVEANVETIRVLGMTFDEFKTWFSSQMKLNMEAGATPAWVQTLVSFAWPALPGAPIWLVGLMKWTWPNLGESEDWVATLLEWAWPDLPTVEAWLSALIAWSWPAFTPHPGWLSGLINWKWPSFPGAPQWVTDLLSWKWPGLPSQISNLFGGGSDTPPSAGQASGTRFWRGGMSWVGEEGPELVNLPRGAQVFNSQRQMEMAGVGGGGVTINPTFVINNGMDLHAAANEVLDILKRGVR